MDWLYERKEMFMFAVVLVFLILSAIIGGINAMQNQSESIIRELKENGSIVIRVDKENGKAINPPKYYRVIGVVKEVDRNAK